MLIPILVIILGLIGFADSLYYTLAHYGHLGFGSPLMPVICNSKKNVCETLAATSWASLLGVPNSAFGMGYYALVMTVAGTRLVTGQWLFPKVIMGIAVVAALVSIYLAWVMVTQVRLICPLCVTAQAINVVLAVAFVVMLK